MKDLLCTALLLIVTCAGCVSNHQEITKVLHSQPEEAPAAPPVTANQVDKDNAHRMSEALRDEMDRAAQNELLTEPTAKTPPSKK
jgi:hypothetical protein